MLIPHCLIGLAIFAGLAAFIGFTFRQGMRVKPDRDKDPDEWTGSAVAARRRTILATLAIPANRQAEVHGSGTRSEGDEFTSQRIPRFKVMFLLSLKSS